MLAARTGQFRHIVFADALNGTGRAVNYSPPECRQAAGPPDRPQCGDDADFIRRLFRRLELCADDYRPESIQRRLAACLRALGVTNVVAARALLERQPRAVHVAARAVLIGVTSFFRDASVFDHLRNSVLPQISSSQRTIRVASIACSDGEELYSVAMLLAESRDLDRAHLHGSDVRADAIAHARRGCFDSEAIRAVPEILRRKYFMLDRWAGHWQISASIVRRTNWRVADMLKAHDPGPWDLILCRNVAMYLKPDLHGGLWARLAESLAPRGFLVLGKAERPVGARLRLRPVGPCIYRREA